MNQAAVEKVEKDHETVANSSEHVELVIHPEEDGITHINISVNGATELGRKLSHFYESPFKHPYFGTFNSMEGFWHYIQNKERDDKLRSLSGMAAKAYGKTLTWQGIDKFYEIIQAANFYKIEQNPRLKELFVDSTLPFKQYYIHNATGDADGQGSVVIQLAHYKQVVHGFEENRVMMQYGERPKSIDYKTIFG